MSRGPIRQAFARLEVEGHVELRRHRGAFVSTLTQTDVEEVHTLRGAIERLAASRACTGLQGNGFAKLDAVLEQMKSVDTKIDPEDAVKLDLQFHDIIYAHCDHSRVQRVWASIRGQVTVFLRARNVSFPDFLEVGYVEHLELRDALALGDPQAAQDAIDKHILGAYERLKRLNFLTGKQPGRVRAIGPLAHSSGARRTRWCVASSRAARVDSPMRGVDR